MRESVSGALREIPHVSVVQYSAVFCDVREAIRQHSWCVLLSAGDCIKKDLAALAYGFHQDQASQGYVQNQRQGLLPCE